jgi:tetratricopeptide (TPR) repeat protein
MKTLKKIELILALVWVALAPPVAAEWKPSQADMGALPPYCAARFDEKSDAFKRWRASMGGDFIHVHHYCAGINFVNRARGIASAKDRQGTLGAALTNFDYMLSHTQPDFYLRPEILMNRGIALSLMNKPGEAVGDLLKAIEADPKLPRVYVTLADMYDKQKNRGKALEVVTQGLRHNPDTRSLQRRYTELGGKLPYPAPLEPASPEVSAAKPEDIPAVAPAQAVVEPAPAATVASPEPLVQPTIGSPKNPYCRFCPD